MKKMILTAVAVILACAFPALAGDADDQGKSAQKDKATAEAQPSEDAAGTKADARAVRREAREARKARKVQQRKAREERRLREDAARRRLESLAPTTAQSSGGSVNVTGMQVPGSFDGGASSVGGGLGGTALPASAPSPSPGVSPGTGEPRNIDGSSRGRGRQGVTRQVDTTSPSQYGTIRSKSSKPDNNTPTAIPKANVPSRDTVDGTGAKKGSKPAKESSKKKK